MILRQETIDAVKMAAAALRAAGRLRSPERDTLFSALSVASTELESIVKREYPRLFHWYIPPPARCGGWKSARQLARAAEDWLERGPSYAAARAAQVYGIGATLAGTGNPVLAILSHVQGA